MATTLGIDTILNQKDELLLFGYIRRIEQEYKSISIPQELISIFALFYVEVAGWNKKLKSKDITIKDDGYTIENSSDPQFMSTGYWRSIFGTRICCENGKYQWTFEIVDSFYLSKGSMPNDWRLFIGIMKDEYCNQHLGEDCIYHGQSIGFVTNRSFIAHGGHPTYKYGQECSKKGNKLIMTLDLDELSLKYIINGVDYGDGNEYIDTENKQEKTKIFNLNKKDKYRLAVAICPDTILKLC